MRAGAWVCMLTLAMMPAARAETAPDPTMTLQLTVDDAPLCPDLGEFLGARAREFWGEAAVTGDSARFRVEVRWPAERSISVRVSEAQALLAERILVVTDPDAAKLTVWLLIKSTLKRASFERHDAPAAAAAEAAVAPVGATTPAVVETPFASKVENAAAPEEAVAVPRLPPASAVRMNALISFSVGTPRNFAAGPALGAWWRPWHRLRLGADLGYRLAPAIAGLVVHHVPLRLYAGWQHGDDAGITVGGTAAVDIKTAAVPGRTRVAAGVDVGGFAQLRAPFERPGAGVILRAAICGRVLRQRYRLNDGDVVERPWDATLSAGVEWP